MFVLIYYFTYGWLKCLFQDAGYGERSFFAIEEENDDDSGIKLDDEVSEKILQICLKMRSLGS